MPTFLITNDDGVDSPFLPPMVAALRRAGEVRVCVPAAEQSWKAKAMTRWGRIEARAVDRFGVPAFAVTGTPSDCVNLALHHLFPAAPDWVVSGINIGWNAGAAFAVNSGTVGAAIEAALCGVPAVAFSAFMEPGLFNEWSTQRRLDSTQAAAVVSSTSERMAAMMAGLAASGLPPGAQVLNVNFPGPVTPRTPVRWAPLQDNRYGSLFVREGDGFVHRFQHNLRAAGSAPSDRDAVQSGEISATLLSLAGWSLPAPPGFTLR
jgi:5'-nucleotidase